MSRLPNLHLSLRGRHHSSEEDDTSPSSSTADGARHRSRSPLGRFAKHRKSISPRGSSLNTTPRTKTEEYYSEVIVKKYPKLFLSEAPVADHISALIVDRKLIIGIVDKYGDLKFVAGESIYLEGEIGLSCAANAFTFLKFAERNLPKLEEDIQAARSKGFVILSTELRKRIKTRILDVQNESYFHEPEYSVMYIPQMRRCVMYNLENITKEKYTLVLECLMEEMFLLGDTLSSPRGKECVLL